MKRRQEMNVQWQDFIEERHGLMGGKPTLKGTRLTVDFVLRQLAAGMSHEQMLEQYPTLKPEHLSASLLYAADVVTMDQRIYQ
jgi:uncharacterized protein (DUF433 family)